MEYGRQKVSEWETLRSQAEHLELGSVCDTGNSGKVLTQTGSACSLAGREI